MSEEDDDFWEELSFRRARLLSAVVGTGERDLEDGLSVSAQAEAHGGSTEDLRMLRVRLLNCIGDKTLRSSCGRQGRRLYAMIGTGHCECRCSSGNTLSLGCWQ